MKSKINYFFEGIKTFRYGIPPKRWIKDCILKEKSSLGVLNFIFCSDSYLQNINKTYLNKSYLTDVITFVHNSPDFLNLQTKNHVSGDIFISIERVKENTKTYKTIFTLELKRVMIHGALHLMGFKDNSKKEKLIMRSKENAYIKIC
tara:strand:- start:586 stop:1026 length:441 start_codon:yes stop_codon:yes gene_type:complete